MLSSVAQLPLLLVKSCFQIGGAIRSKVVDNTYGVLHRMIGRQIVVGLSRRLPPGTVVDLRKKLVTELGGRPVEFAAADGARLEGMHFVGQGCNLGSRTIVLFSGNSLRYEEYGTSYYFDLKLWLDAGYNVFVFNYRGIGGSQGKFSRDGMVSDGHAAVREVISLGVEEKDLILHGHSLGAGIASEVVLSYPLAAYCNDRSFESLSKTVRVRIRIKILGALASKIIVGLGWEFDSRANWNKITGRKWIVHVAGDPVIVKGSRFLETFAGTSDKPVIVYLDPRLPQGHIRGLNQAEVEDYCRAANAGVDHMPEGIRRLAT